MSKLSFSKTPILLISDILAIIVLFIIQSRMQTVAKEIKNVNSETAKFTPINIEAIKTQIDKSKDQKDQLVSLFPTELQLVDMISKLNEIKNGGILTSITFPSDDTVLDKTGNLGLPILLIFKGNVSDINNSLKKINSLPFIIRPIDFKLNTEQNASGSAAVDYGGFLYVNEKFKN